MQGNALCNGKTSHCIMYQSRMSYLKSRENESRPLSKLSKGKSLLGGKSSKSCSSERLLPPIELMTREKSCRYLSWKYCDKKNNIKRLDFLIKKNRIPDKKREEIISRNTISDKGTDKLKEKENDSSYKVEPSQSINDLLDDEIVDHAILPPIKVENAGLLLTEKQKYRERSRGLLVKDKLLPGSDIANVKPMKTLLAIKKKNSTPDGELSFGESFSFLNEWKSERKQVFTKNQIKI